MWLATFHSLCARLLRAEATRLDLPRSFVIYDETDQAQVVREIAAEMQLHPDLYPPGRLLAALERAKNDGLNPEDVARARPGNAFAEQLAELYRRYSLRLAAYGALDFSDLLLLPIRLFTTHPDILARYQDRFRHLLVDEYQDTNRPQYHLLRLLAQRHRNLCVVGDDDQSIYAWRGADLRNILEFEKDFPGARIIRLEQNYRSTQTIL